MERTPKKQKSDSQVSSSQKSTPTKDAVGNSKEKESKDNNSTQLPLARIRTIMKSAPDSDLIAQEALVLVCKAAEMFVQDITKRANKQSKKASLLEYKDLAEVVAEDEKLEFLGSIIPKKITVKRYRELMEEEDSSSDGSNENSDESGSDEEESGEEEEESGSDVDQEGADDDVVSISSDEKGKTK